MSRKFSIFIEWAHDRTFGYSVKLRDGLVKRTLAWFPTRARSQGIYGRLLARSPPAGGIREWRLLWRKALLRVGTRACFKGARFGIGSFFGDTPLGFACLHHPEGSLNPRFCFYQRKATINEAQADAFRNQLASG